MPVYAFLAYENLRCPHCETRLPEGDASARRHVTFQWGYCASRYPADAIYRVGDRVRWRESTDGVVPAWMMFDGGRTINCGDPAITSLIATDIGSDSSNFPFDCLACAHRLGGAALRIEDNVIVSAWAHRIGEIIPGHPVDRWDADWHLGQPDGTFVPVTETEEIAWRFADP